MKILNSSARPPVFLAAPLAPNIKTLVSSNEKGFSQGVKLPNSWTLKNNKPKGTYALII